jgi:hypothetical protein
MKTVILIFIIAVVGLAAGCSEKPSSESANTNAALSSSPETEVKPDGTTLMVNESKSGIKSEIKTFPEGALLQVVRVSWPDGRRVATIKMRNNYSVDLQDKNDIDRAIEMSGDELIAAVKKIPGAVEYATAPPTPTVTKPQETKAEVKKEEKPVPVKVINEGGPSKPTDKSKPVASKKRQ